MLTWWALGQRVAEKTTHFWTGIAVWLGCRTEMPEHYRISEGRDTYLEITVESRPGVPRDITNDVLFFTAKRDIADSDDVAPIKKQTGQGITVLSGPLGRALLHFTPADAASGLVGKILVFDISAVTEEGRLHSLISDTLEVTPIVTRRATAA